MDNLKRLENWFFSHCDNDWEHGNRIKIYNLDNPGWGVRIDLTETLLEEIKFDAVEYGNSEDRSATWVKCYKQEASFIGLGSYNMLDIILQKFLDWADTNTDTSPWDGIISQLDIEIQLVSKNGLIDAKERLKKIYKEIVDIPTEHPKKQDLIRSFDDVWDKQLD